MKKVETISAQIYEHCTYQIDKISDGVDCTVIVKNLKYAPYGVCSFLKYMEVGETIDSSLVNWHNLFFCSRYYGPPVHGGYMNYAVQSGTKTAAIAYVSHPDEYKKLLQTLPDNCHAVPYCSTLENMTTAYVYRDGTLNDLFGFEKVKRIYMLHGIYNIDWGRVEELFSQPLAYFADVDKCGIDLQDAQGDENLIVTGLLLGYPVESTVAYINGNMKCFGDGLTDYKVREHFQTSKEPYVDSLRRKWYQTDDNTYYCEGRQESLYY